MKPNNVLTTVGMMAFLMVMVVSIYVTYQEKAYACEGNCCAQCGRDGDEWRCFTRLSWGANWCMVDGRGESCTVFGSCGGGPAK